MASTTILKPPIVILFDPELQREWPMLFYIRPVIDSFRQINENKLDYL